MLELQIIGNLGQDATIKDFNGQRFISFSLGVNENYTDRQGVKHERTTWVSCLKFTTDQSTLINYLKVGTRVFVRGKASAKGFVTKDGNVGAGLNCKVDELELLSVKRAEQPISAPQTEAANTTPTDTEKTRQAANLYAKTGVSVQQAAMQMPNEDDDLPF